AALTDPCSSTRTTLASPGETGWHRYRFDRLGSSYILQIDGAQGAAWTEPYGNNFPLDLWLGNATSLGSGGAWTSFTLASLRVLGYDDAPAQVSLSDFS